MNIFKNYCIVVMGHTEGVIDEINGVSDLTPPNILDAKGILLSTFSSVFNISELNETFKTFKRSFLIFELDDKTSGVNITNKNIHNGLFGFLKTTNTLFTSDEFLRAIEMTSETKNRVVPIKRSLIKEKSLTIEDVAKMTKTDKEELQNKLIDRGVENLTEEDKKILQNLWK